MIIARYNIKWSLLSEKYHLYAFMMLYLPNKRMTKEMVTNMQIKLWLMMDTLVLLCLSFYSNMLCLEVPKLL